MKRFFLLTLSFLGLCFLTYATTTEVVIYGWKKPGSLIETVQNPNGSISVKVDCDEGGAICARYSFTISGENSDQTRTDVALEIVDDETGATYNYQGEYIEHLITPTESGNEVFFKLMP